MKLPRSLDAPVPVKDDPEATDHVVTRIVVRPDQVEQSDCRPWSEISLMQVVVSFLAVSAVVVTIGLGLLLLGLEMRSVR